MRRKKAIAALGHLGAIVSEGVMILLLLSPVLAATSIVQTEPGGSLRDGKDKHMMMNALFNALDELDILDPVTNLDVERDLRVSLQFDAAHSNEFFLFYLGKATGVEPFPITQVDFRVPKPSATAKGIFLFLDLDPDFKLLTSDVIAKYGQASEIRVSPPPSVKTTATYVYRRKHGTFRFGVKSGSKDQIITIVIDRTQ